MAQVAPLAAPTGSEADKKSPPKAKVKAKGGDQFLKVAVTEPYADDTDLYFPKITRKDRLEYWNKMMDQRARRVPKKNFFSYFDNLAMGDPEAGKFPFMFKIGLAIVKSKTWDYLYLGLFMLWLLLEVAVYDGIAAKYAPAGLIPSDATGSLDGSNSTSSIGSSNAAAIAGAAAIGLTPTTMLVPLVFMFVVQCIPTLGIIYFVCRCNDLTRFMARGKMGNWAFTAVLMAQAIEFWFYGGRARSHKAGKCKVESSWASSFSLSSSAKTHIKGDDVEARKDQYASDDSEAEHAFDEDTSDEEVATKIDRAHEAACRDAEEKGEEPPPKPAEEVSVLAQLRAKHAAEAEAKRLEDEAKRMALEAACKNWTEWTCLVCNKHNRRPTIPMREVDVRFGTKGSFYKRTYAIIRQSRAAPQCTHCMTYADYEPPMGSAHWFRYNKKPYMAFQNYPIKTQIQSGLSNRRIDVWYNAVRSFFFGVKDNSKSKLVFNDWRLRVYVNGVFPELPRLVKPTNELFEVGEMVECRLQKSDWARCQILVARSNHTYDIRYDPGDELRLVLEENLRLPPEKRSFAYRVETMMVVLVLFFPLGIIAASIAVPAAIVLGPLLVALVLFPIRLYRTIMTMRTYHYAGMCPIFRLALFFTLPLFLLLLGSVLPFLGASWTIVAILLIGAKLTACPVLYVQKPNFAVFALGLFLQTSAGLYLLGAYMDGNPVHPMLGVALAPIFTACVSAIYIRRNLHAVWDVQLTIRPPINFIPDPRTLKQKFEDFVGFSF